MMLKIGISKVLLLALALSGVLVVALFCLPVFTGSVNEAAVDEGYVEPSAVANKAGVAERQADSNSVKAAPQRVASSSEPLLITFPRSEGGLFDTRELYYLDLLRLATTKMGYSVSLEPKYLPEMRDNRGAEELKKQTFDVYWMATDKQREASLQPIRIPIYKGLNGWRISLVNSERKNIFSQVETLDDLKTFTAVQGNDWPDTDVLIANGLTVRRSVSWSGMFEQVSYNRQDYFPRSVIEIVSEKKERPTMSLDIEPNIVLIYPTAFYFFVAKENTQLANILSQGLGIAIKDGSFDAMFMKHHGDSVRQAQLDRRKRFYLVNPELPESTPLDNPSLWYSPTPP